MTKLYHTFGFVFVTHIRKNLRIWLSTITKDCQWTPPLP